MPAEGNHDQRRLDKMLAGGLAWTAGAKWATQFITWASLLIVAHLLSPSDYGLGEMAGFLFILSNVMAEFGVGTAVLYLPQLTRRTLAQLHLFSCLLCTGVFLVASCAAPLVAAFFHSKNVLFFVVNNLALFITGFQLVPNALLQKDMDYRRLSLIEASMVLAQSAVTIVTAWLGWGPWALFAGAAAGKVTAAIMVCSWKHVGFAWPRWEDIREPVRVGRQAAVGRFGWAIYSQADGIVVGAVLGGSTLGVYKMAMNLASAPAEKISTLLMRIAMPLFANINTDHSLVRRYYLILVEMLSLAVMPAMLGLAMVAPLAVAVLFDPKWSGAAGPLRWLAVFMILRTTGVLTEQVLNSQLLTRFTMRMSIFNSLAMPIAFACAARWIGIGGVAASWVALAPLTIVPLVIILLRHIELPYAQYLRALLPAITGSAATCCMVFLVNRWIGSAPWPTGARFGVEVAAGASVYGLVLLTFFRGRMLRYVNFLTGLRKGRDVPVPATL